MTHTNAPSAEVGRRERARPRACVGQEGPHGDAPLLPQTAFANKTGMMTTLALTMDSIRTEIGQSQHFEEL